MTSKDLIFCMGESASMFTLLDRQSDTVRGKAYRAYMHASAAEWRAFKTLQFAYHEKCEDWDEAEDIQHGVSNCDTIHGEHLHVFYE